MEICTVSHLSEVTRMVLVEVDPVMVLATSVSATSRVLPVLSDPGQNISERAREQTRNHFLQMNNYLPCPWDT